MLAPSVVGLGGVTFVPYKGLDVQSYRSHSFKLQNANISDPCVTGAKIEFENDDEMTQVWVEYNMMKPSDLSEEELHANNSVETIVSHSSKIANDGSVFQPKNS